MVFRDDFSGTALRADRLQDIKPSDNAGALVVGGQQTGDERWPTR